ncbi:ABC transporter ATP-binding protein [Amycolatopsis pithecellobii]|nr:oligopeptide/dipeptide ABC transporter ATP-binding protein [Amycolatopsis pithecellobii]
MPEPLLEIDQVSVEYHRGRRTPPLRAVDNVTLSVAPGETLAIVGESGSGKSTLGNAVLGLAPVLGGAIRFRGRDITHADHRERRALSRHIQVVFQDPYGSLNPVRTIGQTLAEPFLVHRNLDSAAARAEVTAMLRRVGLPADAADRYPAKFSGGQRQRIAIARALMLSPQLIICDEAVSALDLSVQAQILNLLSDLQREFGLSYLFISHDLDVVRHISHRVAVLLHGRLVEQGPTAVVTTDPTHPYTQALLAAVPVPDPQEQLRRRTRRNLEKRPRPGESSGRSGGCPFSGRCMHTMEICITETPPPSNVSSGGMVACHLHAGHVLLETPTQQAV